MRALRSELYHISGVRTRVQKVKPKMAEIEGATDQRIRFCCFAYNDWQVSSLKTVHRTKIDVL